MGVGFGVDLHEQRSGGHFFILVQKYTHHASVRNELIACGLGHFFVPGLDAALEENSTVRTKTLTASSAPIIPKRCLAATRSK